MSFWIRNLPIAALVCVALMLSSSTVAAPTQPANSVESNPAVSLRNRYETLREQLTQSPLQRGLHLESLQDKYTLQGDVYALVDHSYAETSNAFVHPDNWCEALILHLNVKYCRVVQLEGRSVLSVALGKKVDQALSDTHRVQFSYETKGSPEFTHVALTAKKGPLGTKDYRMTLEIVPVDASQSFMHIRFSYTNGVLSNLATNVYLATIGKNKVGFTRNHAPDGLQRTLVGGVRGAAERNTMRYFLAIDTYLSTVALPPAERFDERTKRWFAATERYARQLHEVERDAYLTMKRAEYFRQQTLQE